MRVIVFGATGMVGRGVMRAALADPEVQVVLAVGRRVTGESHAKLQELCVDDLSTLSAVAERLRSYDACFFCLGVSAAGLNEASYRRITYDLTLSVARTLLEQSPALTFIYVSGAGTDSSARGRTMWARVKGETENALLALPFRAAYMFRPAFIRPQPGIQSRTRLYNALYKLTRPIYPLLERMAPALVTTSEQISQAMLNAAKRGAPKRVLESMDINALARSSLLPPAP